MGILSGPIDMDPKKRKTADYPRVGARVGLAVTHRATGTSGHIISFATAKVVIRDTEGRNHAFKPRDGDFLVDKKPVSLRGVKTTTEVPRRSASGSIDAGPVSARIARPSRIAVEGLHDAELVEKVWGDDLRVEGVVVEYLEGMDDLEVVVRTFGPGPRRRLGILLDHLVDGTKEQRTAERIDHPDVLICGHPYVDVWQAVKPRVLGIESWPVIPKGRPWKEGVCDALGWTDTTGAFWKHLLSKVNSYTDLEPGLIGAVEQLIDFVATSGIGGDQPDRHGNHRGRIVSLRIVSGFMDLSLFDDRDPLAETDQRRQLRETVRSLVARLSPPERVRMLDEAETFDDELYAALAEMGILAIDAPADAGGSGDLRDQAVVIEELAAGPTSMAAFLIVQFMIIQVLGSFASNELHRSVLTDLVAGRTKVSFAMSEADGGTDIARAMKTRATETDGVWTINGTKLWTSGASRSDWLIVLARTREPQRSSVDGVTMFLVPTGAPGLGISEIDTFGIHGLSTCEVSFTDVEVGAEALIGTVHAGFRQAFATLNREGLNAAAACIGVARGALAFAADYARDRQVFGKAVGSFQVPQHWLADGAVRLECARSLAARAAAIEVAGGNAELLAQMAKLTASETAQHVCLSGMQLMGGFGYSREFPMQRWFRDVRLWSFAPLNNEMVRNRIGERLLELPRSY